MDMGLGYKFDFLAPSPGAGGAGVGSVGAVGGGGRGAGGTGRGPNVEGMDLSGCGYYNEF